MKSIIATFVVTDRVTVSQFINTENDEVTFELLNGRIIFSVNRDAIMFDHNNDRIGKFYLDRRLDHWTWRNSPDGIAETMINTGTKSLLNAEILIVRWLLNPT